MRILHVLTDKDRRAEYINKYICTFKKRAANKRNLKLIIFSCLLGMRLEWGAGWGEAVSRAGDGEEGGSLRKINIIGIFLYKDANGILS